MPHLNKIFITCLLVLVCTDSSYAVIQVGDKFPPLYTQALSGGSLPVTTGKVTLIDFWASWCAPCKASFPAYAQLHAAYEARGLIIVAVSADENQAAFEAFVKKETPPFTTLRDKSHELVSEVKVPAMPTCYLLDRDGRVRFVHQGFHGATTDQELRREIETLLAELSTTS